MSQTIEQRLEDVERELATLKVVVKTLKPGPSWITSMSGTFKDDPEFDEILLLGKQLQDSDGPPVEYSGPRKVDHSGHLYLLTFFALSTPTWMPPDKPRPGSDSQGTDEGAPHRRTRSRPSGPILALAHAHNS